MFVNISPAEYNMEETVTTLVYGTRAKMITNDTQKNVETRMQARMNENYKKLQLQLDLAVQSLRTNKIPLPSEIAVEEAPAVVLEEVKEEVVEDITKLPEFKQEAIDNVVASIAPQEDDPAEVNPPEVKQD